MNLLYCFSFKSDKKKSKKSEAGSSKGKEVDQDAIDHGNWWRIVDSTDFRGGIDVALEAGDFSNCYLSARDNGVFSLGVKHFNELEPYPEEVLSIIKAPDDEKFSMKTGFGKYVGTDSNGRLIATSEAIGARERFEVVFQDVGLLCFC